MDIKSGFLSELNFIQLAAPDVSNNDAFVFDKMYPVAKYVYQTASDFSVASNILLVLIFALSIVVYNLGFAKKLKFWQNIVIYFFLFVGCIFLTFFATYLPVVEGLLIIALVLIMYKIGLRRDKKAQTVQ
ncbi:YlaH-like family protein [Viridibacillus sp. FSL E2-0187]|uniref:YlaH-like family protein n=1 Tax=Viridibacillus TaxID=496496 RepID=UPI001D11627A|nr:YlaH-like family protein [Viridibacillus sp. JNUCC-6]